MGISTNGQINFGILFEEDFPFPWDKEEFQGDIDEWWIYEICGYKNPFELYDGKGEYLDGKKPSEEKSEEYYNLRSAFAMKHPLPITVVNCCSCDYHIDIIAIPNKGLNCLRGDPTPFNPQDLKVSSGSEQKLVSFCEKYCIGDDYYNSPELIPKWYLSSLLC